MKGNNAIAFWGMVGVSLWAFSGPEMLPVQIAQWMFSLIAFFLVAEYLMPFRTEWRATFEDGLTGVVYFFIGGALDVFIAAAVPLAVLLSTERAINGWEVLAALLLLDYAAYWVHRVSHWPSFWRFHYMHHEPDAVNTWLTSVTHAVYILASAAARIGVLLLFGFSWASAGVAMAIVSVFMYYTHWNFDVRAGWFNLLFMGPEAHRWHHYRETATGNYGVVFTFWDRLHGTYVGTVAMEREAVGIHTRGERPTWRDVHRAFVTVRK